MTDISGAVPPRDRFNEASKDMMLHISDKLVDLTRNSEFKERLQVILDPLINHVINRVFPYIILSSILFLIMLLVTVSTFIILIRTGSSMKAGQVTNAISEFPMINGVPEIW
jgi:hypothetical protein